MKKYIDDVIKLLMPGGFFHANNTKALMNSEEYQPGGVAAGFFGKLSNKFSKTTYDKYGRWISHQFNGNTKKLKIYTLYRVNPNVKIVVKFFYLLCSY